MILQLSLCLYVNGCINYWPNILRICVLETCIYVSSLFVEWPCIMIVKCYSSTISLQVDSLAMHEVKKDLHRTLPTNRHFKTGGVGVSSHCHDCDSFIITWTHSTCFNFLSDHIYCTIYSYLDFLHTQIEKLERVLLAYSIHNDKVGYCQVCLWRNVNNLMCL